MKIKKINEKLSFDVEAQAKKVTCEHGKYVKESCTTDCKKVTWSGQSAIHILFSSNSWKQTCNKNTRYTCSTTCHW